MIHQPSAGTQGKVTDMEIDVEHFLKIKQRLNKIMAVSYTHLSICWTWPTSPSTPRTAPA